MFLVCHVCHITWNLLIILMNASILSEIGTLIWHVDTQLMVPVDSPQQWHASHCILDKGEKSPEKARLHPEPRPPSAAPAGTISLTPQPRLAEGADYCSPPGCSSLAPLLSANFLAGDKGKNKTDSGLPSSRPSPETSFS